MKILFKGRTKEEYETEQKKKFSRFPKRCKRCGTIFKVDINDMTIDEHFSWADIVCSCPVCKHKKSKGIKKMEG